MSARSASAPLALARWENAMIAVPLAAVAVPLHLARRIAMVCAMGALIVVRM